jgi:CHAT domain-containing protein
LAFFQNQNRWVDMAHTRSNLCRLRADATPEKAFGDCTAALGTFQRLGLTTAKAHALFPMASMAHARGESEEALRYIQPARRALDSVRSRLEGRDLRSAFSAGRSEFEDLHLTILMDLHRQEPTAAWDLRAFEESEAARGRHLLEMLAAEGVDFLLALPPEIRQRLRRLESRLRLQLNLQVELRERARVHEVAKQQLDAVDRQIEKLLRQFLDLESEIRRVSPRYVELVSPRSLPVDEIQRQLGSDTVMISFDLGSERNFAWVIGPDSFTSVELTPGPGIEAEANAWQTRVSTPATLGYRAAMRNAAGHRLSDLLLAPLVQHLGAKRLVVVADGPLRLIPFAALPWPGTDKLLVQEHEIVRLPAASVLTSIRRQRTVCKPDPLALNAGLLAVVADPVYGPDDDRLALAGRPGLNSLPRLPGSAVESAALLEMASAFRTLSLEGFAARRTSVVDALRHYRIVHFATHAEIDSKRPLLSRIVLSQWDEEGNRRPELLRAFDLYGLGSCAELVVLSACRTVQETQGGGPVGLVRGFMFAGTPRLLASLWQVQDQATSRLMKRFYHHLIKERLAPGEALRQAQLWMQEQEEDPYYWASFVLQGDWLRFSLSDAMKFKNG